MTIRKMTFILTITCVFFISHYNLFHSVIKIFIEQFKEDDDVFQKPYWYFTMYWLCYRNFLTVIRDPSVQTLRIIQKIVSLHFIWFLPQRILTKMFNETLIIGYSHNDRLMLPRFSRFDPIWNTISPRSIISNYCRKLIYTDVFSFVIVSSRVSIIST